MTIEPPEALLWWVVIGKDGGAVEIFKFKDNDAAMNFMDKASMQWSDSYLVHVVRGPFA